MYDEAWIERSHGSRIADLVDRDLLDADAEHARLALGYLRDEPLTALSDAIDNCAGADEATLAAVLLSDDDAELGRLVRKLSFEQALFATESRLTHWRDNALYRVLERQAEARAERMAVMTEAL